MGRKDTVTKDYMKDARVFADAFNYLIYGGRPVIDPEKLHELDSTSIVVPYGTDGAEVPIQKYRDELKYVTAMEDDTAAYLILGAENQSGINYAMPVKNMVYDSMNYAEQVSRSDCSYRKEQKKKKEDPKKQERKKDAVSSGEFLSGFRKDDRLLPVITLVIYFGADEWDAPMNLHKMLSVQEEEILRLVPDYAINLIAPSAMSEEEINLFQTSLREVMLYIKYSKDKKKLTMLVENDEKFKTVDRKAAEVMNTMTDSELNIREEEESVDMCEAIKEMRADSEQIGLQKGEQIGLQIGLQKGQLDSIEKMMKALKISAERAMEILEIPESDYPSYLSKLNRKEI